MLRRFFSVLLLAAVLLRLSLPGYAAETEPTETEPVPIYTVEDLLAIGENPASAYILMADLDMTGIPWRALDFSGTFDGNGHAILNLTITEPGREMPISRDGNRKEYETAYFGFFGTLRDAVVKDLSLINLRAVVRWDGPVFMGGITGFAENCTISGCTVTGTLELRAHDRIFGIGGLVGYGLGLVENCTVDVTLINVDTDPETRDEQYLGGIFAVGYFDVYDSDLTLDGYISDHGYVHSGGVVGMYMEYPWRYAVPGNIRRNNIRAKITFFEDNRDRRAYCEPLVGESLVGYYYQDGNEVDFLRDEKFTYDVELRPEMCPDPAYTETVTAPDCHNFGYTTYTCTGCGYAYTDHYTLRSHPVAEWILVKAPTVEEEGLSVGTCPCGTEFSRTEPRLEPEPTEPPATEVPTEAPQPAEEPETDTTVPAAAAVCGFAALGCAGILLARRRRK